MRVKGAKLLIGWSTRDYLIVDVDERFTFAKAWKFITDNSLENEGVLFRKTSKGFHVIVAYNWLYYRAIISKLKSMKLAHNKSRWVHGDLTLRVNEALGKKLSKRVYVHNLLSTVVGSYGDGVYEYLQFAKLFSDIVIRRLPSASS